MTDTLEPISQGPARGYSWAPFVAQNFVAKKHGAYSPRTITPLAAEIANAVCEARPDLQKPEMQPAVLAYARRQKLSERRESIESISLSCVEFIQVASFGTKRSWVQIPPPRQC